MIILFDCLKYPSTRTNFNLLKAKSCTFTTNANRFDLSFFIHLKASTKY